ncbi:hypothetical protein [Tenacibaculum sp. SDUM215027]|uniref:hypothetical protein n=1 Tax=Tenacibaculum sp. SDUM215027 TaxID=3422596 RepID=UPI003D31498C
MNDYAFNYFDALDIYKFFHQEEIPYNDDEYDQEPDKTVVYSYLNILFKKHQQKVLIIDTTGDELIFLPVAYTLITSQY